MPTYMARLGSGNVKIGHAKNVLRRVGAFQTAHIERLTIIRVLEGGRETEAALHRKFDHLRIAREWFRFCDTMNGDLGFADVPLPTTQRRRPRPTDLTTAAGILAALGGATILATKIKAKRSAIANWSRDGIPGRFWPALARIAAELKQGAITIDVIEQHECARTAPAHRALRGLQKVAA